METADMPYWLGKAARQAREKAGVSRAKVAGQLPQMSESTLSRFETGRVEPGTERPGFRRDIGQIIAAYAAALGLEDGRDLWARALELWREQGVAPGLHAEPGAELRAAIEQQIDDASQHSDQAAKRSSERSHAKLKRQAGESRGDA